MAKLKKNHFLFLLLQFIGMSIGACLAAIALRQFLVPNSILDGGITGISIIINKLTKIKLGILIFCINIPFIII